MSAKYQDAMGIGARFGKPEPFVTVTCNSYWKEIQEALFDGQHSSGRLDGVAQIFKLNFENRFCDIFKKRFSCKLQHICR